MSHHREQILDAIISFLSAYFLYHKVFRLLRQEGGGGAESHATWAGQQPFQPRLLRFFIVRLDISKKNRMYSYEYIYTVRMW